MKILFNATNLKIGGGIQKAFEFVHAIRRWGGEHTWRLLLSNEIAVNLTAEDRADHLEVEIFDISPARRLRGRRGRARIREIERTFQPDLVFTLLGPAYVRFRAPHVTGYAVLLVTQTADKEAWKRSYPGWKALRMRLWLLWQWMWIRGHAAYISETEVDAQGLARVLGRSREEIHVIPNSCSSIYLSADSRKTPPHPMLNALPADAKVLLTFAGPHPHKNHAVLPEVAKALQTKSPETVWRFVITLPEGPWGELKTKADALGVGKMLVNIGPVRPVEGPSLYTRADVMLLPTLMEVFSASYPEAMAMGVPIVTSDRPFAHDVCGDAALYADPFDGEALAEAVLRLMGDQTLRRQQIRHGEKRLTMFGTAEERFRAHLAIFERIHLGR
ncbi:MAG: glycosyltransferase [bacterium]